MEIPIKNTFISKAIKEDKAFCYNYNKSSKFITLSPKNISSIFHIKDIKDLKHNYVYDYSTLYQKYNLKKNTLKKTKSFLNIYPIRPKNTTNLDNSLQSNNANNTYILPKLIWSNNKFNNIKINVNNNSNENISNNENNINYFLNKNMDTIKTSHRSYVVLTKNSEKKANSNSFIIEKPLINNIKLKNKTNRNNILKYLKMYQIGEKEKNSHKKLLVKINSANSSAINNCICKIQNIKRIQKYKNLIENKYINKKIMMKRIELKNIT